MLTECHTRGEDIRVLLLTVEISLFAHILPVADNVAPVQCLDQRVEQVGIITDSVQSTNDATHGCTCNDVDGDTCFLQYFQHTNVRHTLRATTTEY